MIKIFWFQHAYQMALEGQGIIGTPNTKKLRIKLSRNISEDENWDFYYQPKHTKCFNQTGT